MAESEHPLVSAVVHTRDSAATLQACLDSLSWADEVLIVDMESSDETLAIAAKFTDKILTAKPAPRVDGIRNQYLEKTAHSWIFVLDSDEYLASDAGPLLKTLIRDHGDRYDAFALPRFNTICGQVMQGSEWYPDHQIRLFRKGTVVWSDDVHEWPVVITGPHRLKGVIPPECPHIHHHNYATLRDFLRRQLAYALNDIYPTEPADFDFSLYVAKAYEELALRCDPERDGDLSHALSLIMAWDALLRGLIHWDILGRRPPLHYLKGLPVASSKVPWWRVRLKRLLLRHHSLRFFARRPGEVLRWWRWKRKNRAQARR